MQLTNSSNRYGAMAILLHWLMAVLLIALLIIGLYMVGLPISLQKLKLYGWHKEYGLLALMLVIFRLSLAFIQYHAIFSIIVMEKIAARTVHWAFYVFMFTMPITGWLITSAAGLPVSFFGLFVLPDIIAPDPNLMQLFEVIHKWLGYGLIATIVLHACAALKHHFINKDDILKRMLS